MSTAGGRQAARVLVVDDDQAFADSVAEGLAVLGWQTRAVAAQHALELVRARDFDVLVTDLRMPEIDGLTLLGAAKQYAPERAVIIMTAFSAIDSAVECVRRGAFHYLTKPFKVAELDLYMQRALETSDLQRKARDLRPSADDE